MNFLLGAINTNTNNYENIDSVEKINKYKCIGCDQDLILRKGNINYPYFVHKNKSICLYFKDPTTEQLLNDAKLYLQEMIKKNKIILRRLCKDCKCYYIIDLPIYNTTKSLIMDILYLDENKNIICQFNVYAHEKDNINNSPEIFNISMFELNYLRVWENDKIELLCSNKLTVCNDCKLF